MKTFNAIAICLSAILLAACSKDKFETIPKLEVKSYNSREIARGEALTIKLNYFDKEGDLGNGTLTYIRVRTNTIPISDPLRNDKTDTVVSPIPIFPAKSNGELSITITHEFLKEDPLRNDTMYFKISVKDIQGNVSDTVTTKEIIAVQS